MKSQSVSPITVDQSFFDRIPTHDVWDESQTGFRDRLKEELETFQQGYERMSMNTLSPGTPGYTVLYHSVTASVSFLENFICFVNDIYKELTRAKFSKTKAWALVTRLMRRIFMDVGAPRVSVQNQFRTGQDDTICKHIFWAEIQSIEIMDQFKAQSFKDHPAIASEYVKFLVTNTGIESVERLIKRVDAFEEQLKELSKTVKAASAASTTASNKADEVKKSNTEILRRLAALEKGRWVAGKLSVPSVADAISCDSVSYAIRTYGYMSQDCLPAEPSSLQSSNVSKLDVDVTMLTNVEPLVFELVFQQFPVWLLALDPPHVKDLQGCKSFVSVDWTSGSSCVTCSTRSATFRCEQIAFWYHNIYVRNSFD
jgi:hypothetical protein